jgi:RluA family pseudouridine synthase
LKKYFQEIYKDEHIVVVNKAAGVLSIPDRYDANKVNLKGMLESEYETVYPVHRIDKDTSGLICFALNERSHQDISIQFEKRKVQKKYVAIVHGFPPTVDGCYDQSIVISDNKQKVSVQTRGKESITLFKVLTKYRHFSYLELEIKTGRRHQIRAHLAHHGLPIVADGLYGKSDSFYLSELKGRKYNIKKNEQEKPLIKRQLLHARKMGFIHPMTNKKIEFEAELPKDMRAMLNQLEKLNKLD